MLFIGIGESQNVDRTTTAAINEDDDAHKNAKNGNDVTPCVDAAPVRRGLQIPLSEEKHTSKLLS